MAIHVRLTEAQALQILELIGRVELADRRTLESLRVNGHHLGTLERAGYEIASAVSRGDGGRERSRRAIIRLSMGAADRMTLDADDVEVIPPRKRKKA